MENTTIQNFRIEIDNLIDEAHQLLSDIIEATKSSDNLAKANNVEWFNRHRLHVLLDVAKETRKKLSRNVIVAPWFLTELKATVEIIKRWKDDPLWKDIEPSLKNKDHFTHTLGKLRIAEHIMKSGYKVELIPRGGESTPDLRIQALGGTEDWLYIECYQPSVLTGRKEGPSEKILYKKVNDSMDKAKRQFKRKHPGIMAIFCYNQPNKCFEMLKEITILRLDKTNRPYLAGILLLNQSVLYKKDIKRVTFTSILSVEFISNPSYFGRIDIASEIPKYDPTLIKEPFESFKTDDLIGKEIDPLSKKITTKPVRRPYPRKIKKIILPIIDKPEPSTRTIIQSQEESVFPFFKGDGNINYLCGNCSTVLAERIWSISLSKIVILCPSCLSYNEFPKIDELQYPIKGTIVMMKGIYNFSRWVDLKQGIMYFEI